MMAMYGRLFCLYLISLNSIAAPSATADATFRTRGCWNGGSALTPSPCCCLRCCSCSLIHRERASMDVGDLATPVASVGWSSSCTTSSSSTSSPISMRLVGVEFNVKVDPSLLFTLGGVGVGGATFCDATESAWSILSTTFGSDDTAGYIRTERHRDLKVSDSKKRNRRREERRRRLTHLRGCCSSRGPPSWRGFHRGRPVCWSSPCHPGGLVAAVAAGPADT